MSTEMCCVCAAILKVTIQVIDLSVGKYPIFNPEILNWEISPP